MTFVNHEKYGVFFLKFAKKKSLRGVDGTRSKSVTTIDSIEQCRESRFSEKVHSEPFLKGASEYAKEYGVSRVTKFRYGALRVLEVHFASCKDIDTFLKSLKQGKYQGDLKNLLEKEKELEVESLSLDVQLFLTIPSCADDAWFVEAMQEALKGGRKRDQAITADPESVPAAGKVSHAANEVASAYQGTVYTCTYCALCSMTVCVSVSLQFSL